MAGFAADVRAGDIELIAQEVDEQSSRLDQLFDSLAVHLHRDLGFSHCVAPAVRRVRAPIISKRNLMISASGCVINSGARGSEVDCINNMIDVYSPCY
jgi:endonuclease/exonuclease/phosphatase family metal-dependent hydrolase